MDEISAYLPSNAGLALEKPEKKVTIRSANADLALACSRGEPEEVAMAVTTRMKYRQFQALAWIERARTAIELGDALHAEQYAGSALEIASQLRSNFDLGADEITAGGFKIFLPMLVRLVCENRLDGETLRLL